MWFLRTLQKFVKFDQPKFWRSNSTPMKFKRFGHLFFNSRKLWLRFCHFHVWRHFCIALSFKWIISLITHASVLWRHCKYGRQLWFKNYYIRSWAKEFEINIKCKQTFRDWSKIENQIIIVAVYSSITKALKVESSLICFIKFLKFC